MAPRTSPPLLGHWSLMRRPLMPGLRPLMRCPLMPGLCTSCVDPISGASAPLASSPHAGASAPLACAPPMPGHWPLLRCPLKLGLRTPHTGALPLRRRPLKLGLQPHMSYPRSKAVRARDYGPLHSKFAVAPGPLIRPDQQASHTGRNQTSGIAMYNCRALARRPEDLLINSWRAPRPPQCGEHPSMTQQSVAFSGAGTWYGQ